MKTLFLTLAILAILTGCQPAQPDPTPTPPGPVLEVLAVTDETRGGYLIIDGQVRNIGPEPLHHTAAVASYYDEAGTFITSQSALVEYDPVMPGQVSPFRVMVRSNPEMWRYDIGFQRLGGAAIEAVDGRE